MRAPGLRPPPGISGLGRLRRWLARLLLVLVGGALPLIAIEGAMRLHAAHVLVRSPYRLADEPRRNFVRKPHADAETNALGFRDRERDLRKAPGGVRIVVLGDSVTYGHGIALEDRFTHQLEQLLGQNGARVEVVNLGMPQYSTVQEVATFEAIGIDLAPDLVIVAYVLNDPNPEGMINDYFFRERAPSRALAWLERRTRWWRRAVRVLPGCRGHDYYSRIHCNADHWAASEAAFDRLAQLTRASGCPVLLVVFPLLDADPQASFASYRWLDAHRQVIEAAQRRGFATLDLLPALAPYRPAELQVHPDDVLHPNARGHRITAAAIGRALMDSGLVRPRVSHRSAPP